MALVIMFTGKVMKSNKIKQVKGTIQVFMLLKMCYEHRQSQQLVQFSAGGHVNQEKKYSQSLLHGDDKYTKQKLKNC